MITFNKGDRIRVKDNPITRKNMRDKQGYVVGPVPRTVGWDTVVVIIPDHGIVGYPNDYGWYFSDASDRLEIIGTNQPTSSVVSKESPCQVCQRLNDAGVKTCWCCGNSPT